MAQGEIVSVRDVAMNLAHPTETTHKEIQYRVDGMGPYAIYLSVGEYTPAKALELVKGKIAEWAAIVGKSIEVK